MAINTSDDHYDHVLNQYEGLIHAVLKSAGIAPNHWDYEDLAQELRWRLCEIAAKTPCDPFQEPQAFTNYAWPRLYHRFIDLRRSAYKHKQEDSLDMHIEQGGSGPVSTMDEAIITKLTLNEMRASLSTANQHLLDRLYADWTLTAIAQELGISVPAVSKRCRVLKKQLAPWFLAD